MKVKLEDVCECGSSNLRQSDAAGKSGDYPIYGASGYIGNVDFYYQERPYVAVVKDGAGVGRAMLLPAKSSVIGTMQYLLPKGNVLPEYLMLSAIISMKMQRKPCKKRLTGCWLQKQAERQCNRWGQRQLELRYV